MKLIEDIINELVDHEKPIVSPLLKTKVLASRLGNKLLQEWVHKELMGYDSESDLPHYRKYNANISGTCIIGNQKAENYPVPIHILNNELRNQIRYWNFYQGVEWIEAYNTDDDSAILEEILPSEATFLLNTAIRELNNHSIEVLRIRRYVSATVVKQIISVIRAKLLDFMLKIDEE